ncbi:MAG: TonB-dependent receptor [Bacteroidota bacterium]
MSARLLSVFALAALLAAPSTAQGNRPQGAVTATIVDDVTGDPLPQATLALYSARDTSFVTGGAADVDGTVTIDPVRPGSYVARASFIGYETFRISDVTVAVGPATDLGEIRLAEGAALLGEAEVTAEREFIEQQADRTVYNVQEQAVTAGGSAIETLQTLPSLEVDTDGNVSLRGNQNVVIQINGRPTPVRGAFLAALLRQIPAEKVERVEVIPNPSARFEAEGMAGIVNIVLAEGVERGLSGGLTFGGGTELSGNIGANLNYQRGDWDLNGQYGYRYGQRDVNVESLTEIGDVFSRDAITINESDEQSHFFTGSADYAFNDQTRLTLETSLGIRGGGEDGTATFLETAGSDPTSERTRIDDGDNDGYNGDVALVFRRQFVNAAGGEGGGPPSAGRGRRGGPPGMFSSRGGGGTQSDHELAIESRFTRFNNGGLGTFEDFGFGAVVLGAQSQFNDQTNDEGRLQLDYTRPIGETKLETGALGVFEWVASETELQIGDNLGSLTIDPNQTNAFDYDRQVGAAYLQASRAFGPVQLQGGVRMEATQRNFDLLTEVPEEANPFFDPSAETSASYVDLFPSIFATYSFAPGTLIRGSYRRGLDRPQTFSLNPFPDLSDTTFVRVGNPTLRPQYTDSFELTLQYKFFATLTPFLRRTTDSITRRVTADPETGVGLFSVANIDTETNYGTDLTLFGQFGPVRGFLSGSIFQTELADAATSGDNIEDFIWNARTSLQWEVRDGTNLQGFFLYNPPRRSIDGERRAFTITSFGLSQRLMENLQLSARVSDPFGLSTFEFVTNDGRVFRDTTFDPNIRQASMTLTYTFGSNQRRPRQQQPQQQPGGDGFAI